MPEAMQDGMQKSERCIKGVKMANFRLAMTTQLTPMTPCHAEDIRDSNMTNTSIEKACKRGY